MRRRVLAARGVVAAVVLWPAVTLVWQRQCDADVWKLMSFGMYAAPARRLSDVQLSLWVQRGDAWERVGSAAAALDYQRRRQTFGHCADVAPLMAELLSQPGALLARVAIETVHLDPRIARVAVRRDELCRGTAGAVTCPALPEQQAAEQPDHQAQ